MQFHEMSYTSRHGWTERDNTSTKVSITRKCTRLNSLFFLHASFVALSHSDSMSIAVFSSAVSDSYFSLLCPSISPELINFFMILAELATHILFTLKTTPESNITLLHILLSNLVTSCHAFNLLSEIL